LQAHGGTLPDDVLVVFSTSGTSENVVRAARAHLGATVALLGQSVLVGDPLGPGSVEVNSTATGTPAIQEEHQRWVHEIARRVEMEMFPR
jgi:phosphoheptose isomerase